MVSGAMVKRSSLDLQHFVVGAVADGVDGDLRPCALAPATAAFIRPSVIDCMVRPRLLASSAKGSKSAAVFPFVRNQRC